MGYKSQRSNTAGHYNAGVPPARRPETNARKTSIARVETLGLLLLSLIVMLITLIRFWGQIRWSVW